MALLSLLKQATASMWPSTESDDGAPVVVERPSRRSSGRPRTDLHYCRALAVDPNVGDPDANPSLGDPTLRRDAWKSLERDMALTPAGAVRLATAAPVRREGRFELVSGWSAPQSVEPFYIDRHAVTNAEFWAFVEAGAYTDVDLWPPELLPFVLQCVDQTGAPGPKFWRDGRPPEERLDHPVVGVSWYEARAYAQWIGKRLLTPADWQHAAGWHSPEGHELRYPWGDSFQRGKANLRSPHRQTVAVGEFVEGCTPNGVFQLIGNVWEWLDADFQLDAGAESLMVSYDQPMAEIRGAAYDTYFETQATSQFRTGKAKLFRGHNIGFRCGVAVSQLQPQPTALDLLDQDLDEPE